MEGFEAIDLRLELGRPQVKVYSSRRQESHTDPELKKGLPEVVRVGLRKGVAPKDAPE